VGSSGWFSRVPYQPDIAAALQVARWRTFRSGEYHHRRPIPEARQMTEDEYVAWYASTLDEFARSMSRNYEECRVEWRAAQIDPVDPDSLLASYPYGATVSVIDMIGVADKPTDDMVAPADDQLLEELFSTLTPSTADVEAIASTYSLDPYGRGRGAYIIGYRDGKPDTIFFVGFTGD